MKLSPRNFLYFAGLILLASACSDDVPDPALDYFSFANSQEFSTRHLELELDVDFELQQLRGSATLHMQRLSPDARSIILDSRGLVISQVSLSLPGAAFTPADFRLGETDKIKGEALTITIPQDFNIPPGPESIFLLKIEYHTGPGASALQWLPPELTAGGRQPFMFTQSQSIHARSWIPLQDTPSVRLTYEAVIHTPPGLLALMSAENDPDSTAGGNYRFSMPQPIPSYLLALAVGDIRSASIGPQVAVFAEPEVLEAAAYEFADTQDMLDTAAAIYGPYQWGRYDLLILPPSFPFGGMENPRLSFITPSVLAGDRSLVSLIAHELAHSWSGNLVSNATWRDIWLNEGTTSYLESRLMEVLFGKERADEERVLAYRELLADFEDVIPAMQALAPQFNSGDPDESQGIVPYHKGQLLLTRLEYAFGRETFDDFLAAYFTHFQFQAISSEQFLDYLDQNLLQTQPGLYSREQVSQWLYEPGLPADAPIPVSANLDEVARLAAAFSQGEISATDLPIANWSPQAVIHFINALPLTLQDKQLSEVDRALGLTTTRNAEIGRSWFIQVANRQYRTAYPEMEQYLLRYGRARLVVPIYRALDANGSDAELAREIFSQARGSYHPITIAGIETSLEQN